MREHDESLTVVLVTTDLTLNTGAQKLVCETSPRHCVVLFSAVLLCMLMGWMSFCFGILLHPLLEEFQLGPGKTAILGSLTLTAALSVAPFAGRAVDLHGSRIVCGTGAFLTTAGFLMSSLAANFWQLCLTYGIVCGVGFQCGYSSVIGIIPRYFKKNRGIAIGISEAGVGLGGIVFPFYMQATIDNIGYKKYFLTAAAITLVVHTIAVISFKTPPGRVYQHQTKKKFNISGMLCISLAMFCYSFGFTVPTVFAVEFAIEQGIPVERTSWFVSAIGLGSMTGLSSFGFAISKLKLKPLHLFIFLCLSAGTLTLLNQFYTTFTQVAAFYVFYGLFVDSVFLPLQLLCVEHIGIEYVAQAIGIGTASMAPGVISGVPIAGFLKEHTGSYYIGFTVAAIFISSASIFLVLLPFVSKKQEPNSNVKREMSIDHDALETVPT